MRIGDIYKNLWAGYETYFVYIGTTVRSRRVPSTCTQGYSITRVGERWIFDTAVYDRSALMDSMHFPIVGHIDLDCEKDAFVGKILDSVKHRRKITAPDACNMCRNRRVSRDAYPCNRCNRNKNLTDFFDVVG